MVHFSGKLTEEQFAAALKMMLGQQPHGRSMLAAAIFFSAFAILAGATLGSTAGIIVLVVFVLPAAAAWWKQSPTRFRRLFAKNEALQHFVQGSYDEREFVYGVNRVPWTSVRRVQSDETLALVYAPNMFIVPRSFFANSEDWSAFLARAQSGIPAVSPGPPLVSSLKSALLWVVIIIAIFLLWSLQQPAGR